MDLLALVRDAFVEARQLQIEHTLPNVNSLRSRAWVQALADQFKHRLKHESLCVLSKHDDSNRLRFGLNELLYDVCVFHTATCVSPVHGKMLHYICKPLRQVESEFASNTQETIWDFNKL